LACILTGYLAFRAGLHESLLQLIRALI